MTHPREHCCNCRSDVSYSVRQPQILCEKCTNDPYRINLLKSCQVLRVLQMERKLSATEFASYVAMLCHLKSKCDTNPFPVIIGIILTELYPDGGKVLMVQRAIDPCIGGWALVSGFVVDQFDWRMNLRKEVMEEASVTLDTAHMTPFSFESNPKNNLLLNFAVVMPEGVVRINDFAPDHETSGRMEFRFSKEVRPPFCFSIHEEMFNQWCKQHFGW